MSGDEDTTRGETGQAMHDAITDWCNADAQRPGVVSRLVIVAEVVHSGGKALQVGAFDADGSPLPLWDTLGLIDVGTDMFRETDADDGEDDEGEE